MAGMKVVRNKGGSRKLEPTKRSIPEAKPQKVKKPGSVRDTTIRRTKEPLRTGRAVKGGD